METEIVQGIKAPRDAVWKVMTDVERWPEWTPSVESIEVVGGGALEAGSKARIKQPRLPALEWTVTQFEPGKNFVWESSSMGVRSIARHEIMEDGNGATSVRLAISQTGLPAVLIAPLLRRVSKRYLEMEARGLASRSEAAAT